MTDSSSCSNFYPFAPGGFLRLSSGGIPGATRGGLRYL